MLGMFFHLSVPHYIQHVIDILEDNFNIADLSARYPKDLDTIIDIVGYIQVGEVCSDHDKGLFEALCGITDLIRNKINLLSKNNHTPSDNNSIVVSLRGLNQDDFFHISDLCYNHLCKINDDYNDIEADDWNLTDNLSPNLLSLFDKPNTSDSKATLVSYNNWIKPAYHGLENSLPIIIVSKPSTANEAVIVGDDVGDNNNHDDDNDDDDDSSMSYGIESSDDGVDPDSYVMHSALSHSLSSLFRSDIPVADTTEHSDKAQSSSSSVTADIKWQAPALPGLNNSTRKYIEMSGMR